MGYKNGGQLEQLGVVTDARGENIRCSDGVKRGGESADGMTHGSLFSGIGGFDLAAEWMGWQNVFHCEWNEFGQRVLKYYFPKAISYEDITKTDFTIHRGRIDILTGGFPCQPYSTAGKRLGKEDDRHLWPEMLRAIREIQPRFVVGENVRGLVNWNGGLVFDEVQTDLEAEGYEVQPFLLPACAVNAPHRRDRIWFVAYADGADAGNDRRTDAGNDRRTDAGTTEEVRRETSGDVFNELRGDGNATDTNSGGWSTGTECQHDDLRKRTLCKNEQNDRNEIRSEFRNGGCNGTTPDTSCRRISGHWGRSEKWRFQTNEFNANNRERQSKLDWQNFPTQPPICGGDDGLPTELDGITFSKWRAESIKGYGNAIVPQVALEIFKQLEKIYLEL